MVLKNQASEATTCSHQPKQEINLGKHKNCFSLRARSGDSTRQTFAWFNPALTTLAFEGVTKNDSRKQAVSSDTAAAQGLQTQNDVPIRLSSVCPHMLWPIRVVTERT